MYVAWSGAYSPALAAILELKLTDSNGAEYIKQDNRGLPNKVQGSWFVPAQGSASPASWYELTIRKEWHNPQGVTIRISDIQHLDGADPVDLFENYMPSVANREWLRALALGDYWSEKKDAARAIRYLDLAGALWENNRGLREWPSPSQWSTMAEHYESFGCKDKARMAFEQALKEMEREARDPRIQGNPEAQKKDREWVESRLRKLR